MDVKHEVGPLSPDLEALVRTATPVDLPPGFGESAGSREEFLDLLTAHLASIGLADTPVRFQTPPQFRVHAPHGADLGLTVGAVGAVSLVGTCADSRSTRRRLLGKLVGIGGIAALLAALGPVGRRVLASGGWCGGLRGDCRDTYCYHCDLWTEFYFCPNRTYPGYCEDYCSSYREVGRCLC